MEDQEKDTRRPIEDPLGGNYSLLFENMLEGFAYCRMLFDGQGRPMDWIYLKVNKAFERLTGLKDVVGKKVTEVIPGIKETNPELFDIYGRVSSMGRSEEFEMYVGPLKIWFHVSAFSLTRGHFVAVFDNITDHKRVEEELARSAERLELALKCANEGIWDWNIGTGHVSYSDLWVEMIGYRPGELKPDVSTWDGLLHPDDKPGTLTELNKHFEDGRHEYKVEFRLKCRDGGWKWIQALGRVYERDADGKPVKMAGIHLDISERRKAEEDKDKLQKRIAQSEKMAAVGQLAAGIAHEINNPLGVIMGFAQSCVNRLTPNDPLELPVKSIEREANRVKILVQGLLAFSRTSKVEIEQCDINQMIDKALALVEVNAKMNSVELVREFDRDIPQAVVNSYQMQEVIINLCNNAIDAMPKGGALTLRTARVRFDGKDGVEIQVRDTGTGIPPEVKARIFEPFFTTKEVGRGTGLGLSISHEIIEKHGGTLSLESKPGRGTTFTIRIPSSRDGG